MINVGDKWTCPRCNEKIEVTMDGIRHISNFNGPHWQKHSLEELNNFADFEKEQLNKLFYGN